MAKERIGGFRQVAFGALWQTLLVRGALILFVLGGLLLAHGYQFPSSNHAAGLPPVLAMVDGGLYEADFFVQEMRRFTPRVYYQYALSFLARAGLGIDAAHFMLYVVALASFIGGLRAIAGIYAGGEGATAFLIFWSLSATAGTIGGSVFWPSIPIPSTLAMGLAVWGVYFGFRRAWVPAFAFFGAACLLQFLAGVLPALLMMPAFVWDVWRRRRWGRAVLAVVLLGVGAGLVYVPMVVLGTTSTGLLSNRVFVEIYGVLRHPHHIVPSAWPLREWVQLLLLYGAGLWALGRLPGLSPGQRLTLLAMVVVTLVGLGLNYLFVEVWPWALVAKLQFSRMTTLAQFAILVGLLPLLCTYIRRRQWIMAAALAVIPVSHVPGLLLFAFLLARRRLEAWSEQASAKGQVWGAVVIAVMAYRFPLSAALPAWLEAIAAGPVLLGVLLVPILVGRWLQGSPLGMLSAIGLAALAWGTLAFFLLGPVPDRVGALSSKHLTTRGVWEGELSVLARRFRERSAKDALVLVPPAASEFRLLSRRSVVVDFKAFPYTDRGMLEWKERLEAIRACAGRPPACLKAVARRYGADYLLALEGVGFAPPEGAVAQEGPWRIWRIPHEEEDR